MSESAYHEWLIKKTKIKRLEVPAWRLLKLAQKATVQSRRSLLEPSQRSSSVSVSPFETNLSAIKGNGSQKDKDSAAAEQKAKLMALMGGGASAGSASGGLL